jgi:hypothetical protein
MFFLDQVEFHFLSLSTRDLVRIQASLVPHNKPTVYRKSFTRLCLIYLADPKWKLEGVVFSGYPVGFR